MRTYTTRELAARWTLTIAETRSRLRDGSVCAFLVRPGVWRLNEQAVKDGPRAR